MKLADTDRTPWEPASEKVTVYDLEKQEAVEVEAMRSTFSFENQRGQNKMEMIVFVLEGAAWVGTPIPRFYIKSKSGITGVYIGTTTIVWFPDDLLPQNPSWRNLEDFLKIFEQETDAERIADLYQQRQTDPINYKYTQLEGEFLKSRGISQLPWARLVEFSFSADQAILTVENEVTHFTAQVWVDLNTREIVKTVELTPAEIIE